MKNGSPPDDDPNRPQLPENAHTDAGELLAEINLLGERISDSEDEIKTLEDILRSLKARENSTTQPMATTQPMPQR
jgi:hypothetical protein